MPSTLATFEQALFEPFTTILQRDIDRMVPLDISWLYLICSRVYPLCIPNLGSDARAAHRRANRISQPPSLPADT